MIIVKYIWKHEILNKIDNEYMRIFKPFNKVVYYEGYFLFGFIPLYIKQTEKVYS